ncbi:hypothetical protein GCM10010193_61930 [Kitasatospora atroaurantiaca]|uniref:Uncharacterized protein n=1 Tax=Kitasatospora atroaurantiaca TaxID=285545 RepID=A0A561EI72_9ACTN|nr:hypothetical protein [Kitasatospora atroaurantiaca]TWE15311.1 hypothetical protein FB465_0201 [Kitasatospora atroaurantiaca]
MRKLDTAELAAAQGTGPTLAAHRLLRDLPRTGRRRAVIRTRWHAPRRNC